MGLKDRGAVCHQIDKRVWFLWWENGTWPLVGLQNYNGPWSVLKKHYIYLVIHILLSCLSHRSQLFCKDFYYCEQIIFLYSLLVFIFPVSLFLLLNPLELKSDSYLSVLTEPSLLLMFLSCSKYSWGEEAVIVEKPLVKQSAFGFAEVLVTLFRSQNLWASLFSSLI